MKNNPLKPAVVLLAALVAGCAAQAVETPAKRVGAEAIPEREVSISEGEPVYDNYCASCHLSDGSGWKNVGAPAIGGLPEWYVRAQLDKFRQGHRGSHIDDINGLKMRPMAMALHNTAQVDNVAAWVAAMPRLRNDATLDGGDPVKGKASYTVCVTCHGENGHGNEGLGAPPLVDHDDWYMLTQLKNFKSGARGRATGDASGATMYPMAQTLADEQAMKDVIAYIRTLR